VQTIRFVGGPYHGRTLAVEDNSAFVNMQATIPASVRAALEDADPFALIPVTVTVRYYREWLHRQTTTLDVREQVMLLERLSPFSTEAIQRWQELRPL